MIRESIVSCVRRTPQLRVIAVNAEGAVIFGASSGYCEIPGIGVSRVPKLLSLDEIDDVISVNDYEATQGCRALVSSEAILAGGLSGAVIAAIWKLLPTLPSAYRLLTILPDRGERYLDLVYNDSRVAHLHSH